MLPYAREWTLLTAGWWGRRKQKLTNCLTRITKHHMRCGYVLWRTPRGYSWEFVVGVFHQAPNPDPISQPRPQGAFPGFGPTSKAGEKRPGDEVAYFRPENCHYPQPFLDLASKIHILFQTWRRQKLCYHYLARSERQQKDFEFAHYSFFLIPLELKLQIRSCIPSKTIPEFKPK